MKILITGNLGYIGPELGPYLRAKIPESYLVGFDLGLFSQCLTSLGRSPDTIFNEQHFGDVRAFPENLLSGVDIVIHLAAISNDPMGEKFNKLTYEINQRASLDLAKKAANQGVSHFLFASSCSVYGAGGACRRVETDQVNPLTAYAQSKIGTEVELKNANFNRMKVTCMRFATACGFSKRTRLDLVLNDFVHKAVFEKKIEILSDGSPWRPLISVKDMAQAINLLIKYRHKNGEQYEIMNVGSDIWNYQVRELAVEVQHKVGAVRVSINQNAEPDQRSYQVSFRKFNTMVKKQFNPETISDVICNLEKGLKTFSERNGGLNVNNFIRLKSLQSVSPEFGWDI